MKSNVEEENTSLIFRELFPPDEARLYARPEAIKLPTQRVAYWSVVVSLLFAGALIASWVYERGTSPQRLSPDPRTDNRTVEPSSDILPAKRKPEEVRQR